MSNRSHAVAVAAYPLAYLACAFALGILAGTFLTNTLWYFVACGALISAGVIAALLKNKLPLATALAVCATLLLGAAFANVDRSVIPPNQLRRLLDEGTVKVGEPVELTGVLEQEPELAPERLFLRLRVRRIRAGNIEREAAGVVMLLARLVRSNEKEFEALELQYGATLRVLTRLERADGFRNPGVSLFTEYLDRQGYDATALVKSPLLMQRLENERVFLPLAWLYDWRRTVQTAIHHHFSKNTAGVLDAALLGNRHFLSQSISERFREGGTFHVLVISGLHITFLGVVVFFMAKRFTRNEGLQFVLSTSVLWGYALAVGGEASVVRAALMFTVVVLAPLVSRHASSLNALGASAFGLLAWHPADLLDPSFQLTFASVAAIVLLCWPLLEKIRAVGTWRPTRETPYPPACAPWLQSFCESLFWSERQWRSELEQANHACRLLKTRSAKALEDFHLQRPLRYAFSTIVVSLGVQIVLLPFLVVYFHRLSFASLLLNIGVSVMMATLALVAMFTLLLAQVSTILAAPFIHLTNGLNWLTVHSVDPFARAGMASMRLPEYSGWTTIVYLLYYLPLAVLAWLLWRWHPLKLSRSERGPSRSRVSFALTAHVFAIALVVFHPWSAPRPDGKLRLDFLDVGQGDSALVTFPDGTTLLVDGGGRPGPFRQDVGSGNDEEKFERDSRSIGETVLSEFLWHRGLDHVDYLLATHADADHLDGLNDIARNFRVRAALVARVPKNDLEFTRFSAALSAQRVPIHMIGAGDQLRFGSVSVSVLWPPSTQSIELHSGNNDSIVLKVLFGRRSFLLTGDIEAPAERVLTTLAETLRTDAVKVAHHGSKTSSIAAFISATQPHYAIISVGQNSIFGHPNPEVVRRWEGSGAQVLRTGTSGTITFTTDGNDLFLETFVRPK